MARKPEEVRAVLWGAGQMFCLLAANYAARSARESFGSERGAVDYPWLYLGTFAATVLAAWGWSSIVPRVTVRRLVAIGHVFFAISFVAVWALLRLSPDARAERLVGHGYFVWYSVYNFFIVSLFWSRAADLFTHGQARRLFPYLVAGGSAGAIVGSAAARILAREIGTIDLLLVPAGLLVVALVCAGRLAAAAPAREIAPEDGPQPDRVAGGGGAWAAFRRALSSPVTALIAVCFLLETFAASFAYTMNGDLAGASFPDRDARTSYYATIDLAVNVIVVALTTLVTSRLIAWLGVGAVLMVLPVVYGVGFSVAAAVPVVAAVAAFDVARRSAGYGMWTPSREVLFTIVPRDARYRGKNLIDTAVRRGGDAAAIWVLQGLLALRGPMDLGGKVTFVALAAIPFAALWFVAAIALGRAHARAAAAYGGPVTTLTQPAASETMR